MSDNTKYATIPGFENMTAQQVFDMSASHLLKQMGRSQSDSEACLYRGPNGLKCAAGVFLTDEGAEAADNSCENTWGGVVARRIAPPENESLIESLQNIHDYRRIDTWREQLKLLAECEGLDDSVCR